MGSLRVSRREYVDHLHLLQVSIAHVHSHIQEYAWSNTILGLWGSLYSLLRLSLSLKTSLGTSIIHCFKLGESSDCWGSSQFCPALRKPPCQLSWQWNESSQGKKPQNPTVQQFFKHKCFSDCCISFFDFYSMEIILSSFIYPFWREAMPTSPSA